MFAKSNIQYAYFVESVSRKFTLKKNTCSNKDAAPISSTLKLKLQPTRYMGGQVRTTERYGLGAVQKNVMFLRMNPRKSAITADEQAARLNFAAAVAKRKAWKGSLQTVTAIRQDWDNPAVVSRGGVQKKGYTINGWVFAVAYNNPESENWPQN